MNSPARLRSATFSLFVFMTLALTFFARPAAALIVNFETVPQLPVGPSLSLGAGPAQTINVNGQVTFSGGIVFGFPASFPASPYSTVPNLYGTVSPLIGGNFSWQPSVTMAIDPSVQAKTVEGLLFNGLTIPRSYTVDAYSGTTLVDSQAFTNLPSNVESGFGVFRLQSDGPSISSVIFNPDRGGGAFGTWDYAIDSIAINQKIETLATVPIPAAVWLFGSGLAAVETLALSSRRTQIHT